MRPYSNTILLAEDDPDDRECYLESFTILKYEGEVKMVDSGASLLQTLNEMANIAPSLLVIDNVLPDIKAEALLQTLKSSEHHKDIPVVVITGRSTPVLEQHLKCIGALDCLEKPFTFTGWNSLVKKLLQINAQTGNGANPFRNEEAA